VKFGINLQKWRFSTLRGTLRSISGHFLHFQNNFEFPSFATDILWLADIWEIGLVSCCCFLGLDDWHYSSRGVTAVCQQLKPDCSILLIVSGQRAVLSVYRNYCKINSRFVRTAMDWVHRATKTAKIKRWYCLAAQLGHVVDVLKVIVKPFHVCSLCSDQTTLNCWVIQRHHNGPSCEPHASHCPHYSAAVRRIVRSRLDTIDHIIQGMHHVRHQCSAACGN